MHAMTEPSPTRAALPAERLLALAAAWLIGLGLVTGGLVSAAMGKQVGAEVHAALASHLNALLGGLWMLGVAYTLPMLRYGAIGQRRLAWTLIVANFANWLVTAIKAFLHVAGVGLTGQPTNDAVFVALTALVVIPALAGAAAWIYGFGGRR